MVKWHVFTTRRYSTLYPSGYISHNWLFIFLRAGRGRWQEATAPSPIELFNRRNIDTPYYGETRQILAAHGKGQRRQSLDWTPQWTDQTLHLSFVLLKLRFGDCSSRQHTFVSASFSYMHRTYHTDKSCAVVSNLCVFRVTLISHAL